MPAQDQLRDRLAEAIGDGLNHCVLKKLVCPTERAPGLRDDAMGLVPHELLGLWKVWVQFHLVDARRLTRLIYDLLQMFGQEVAHTNGADKPPLPCLDKDLPSFDVEAFARVRPMDKIEVVIIELRSVERFLDGGDRLVETVMASGLLRDHA